MDINGAYYLRGAEKNDIELFFRWVNDDAVRRNAFENHVISKEEHEKWFEKVMDDPDVLIYILMLNEKPIGQCRLTVNDGVADIDYSVDSTMRGKGIGKILIDLVEREVRENHAEIVKLIGRVKLRNTASAKCFEDNGFNESYIVFEKEMNVE